MKLKDRAIHIAVNALYCRQGDVGGTETYLSYILKEFLSDSRVSKVTVFACKDFDLGVYFDGKVPENIKLVRAPFLSSHRAVRLLWEQLILPFKVARCGADVLFSPGFTAPRFCSVPSVVVFPDLHHIHRPGDLPLLDLYAHRFFCALSAAGAQRIVFLSETMMDSAQSALPGLYKKAVLSYPPVPAPDFDERRTRDKNLLISIGTFHRHKNHIFLIKLLERLRTHGIDARLLIIGIKGFYAQELFEAASLSPVSNYINIVQNASSAEVTSALLRGGIFLFPTLYEGFGYAPLEGMAFGLPVVASDIPVMREVLRGGALLLPPSDVDGWADSVKRLLLDDLFYSDLVQRGVKRLTELREGNSSIVEIIMNLVD